jgi:hypothetical protein
MLSAPAFIKHPVAQAELKYQWHIIETGRAGKFWIFLAYVLLIPAAVISVIFFAGGLLNQFVPGGVHLLPDEIEALIGGVSATLLVAMNLAMYLVLTMITMGLAANSIHREKRGKTWDSLVLTGVEAHQIVWGKWWATLAALWTDHAAAAVLRLGIVAWGAAVMGSEALYEPILPFLPIMLSYLVAGALLLIVYAIIDAAFTAALGVFMPLTRFDGSAAFVVVIVVRLLITLVPFVVPTLLFTQFEIHFAAFYFRFWLLFLVALALMTWIVLWLAQKQAVHQRATPAAKSNL